MREILFRGKRVEDGDWIYGLLDDEEHDADFTAIIPHRKHRAKYADWEVYPATVGQYTGLKDKNGKRIFEGDVVHILGDQTSDNWKSVDYTALIAFIDGGFCAIDGTIEEHGFRRYALARMDFSLEIIGNIHDSPELLEGGLPNDQ